MPNGKIEAFGEVTKQLPNNQFRVLLDNGETVLGILKGKLKINNIQILPGDRVQMMIGAYDPSKGYITKRV